MRLGRRRPSARLLGWLRLGLASLVFCLHTPLQAVWQKGMNFQGRVLSDGLAFNGVGQFKFALVQTSDGTTTTLWSHDGTSVGGAAPTSSLSLAVTQGQYSVQLGDASAMTSFSDDLFDQSSLSLRVWFDDGVNGVQQLSPDLPITAVLFANRSKVAESVSSLPDEMVELRHLNSALQSTLSDLEQRLAFMESRGAMISNSATDTGLADLGYVLYSESGAEPATISTPANLPSVREEAGSASNASHWLVWGGKSSFGQPLSSGAFQDTSSGVWTTVSSLDAPAPRYDHLQHAVGNLFFIHGGQGASSYLSSAHLFDPAFNEWSSVDTPADLTGRIGNAAVTLADDQSVMLFGGLSLDGLSNRFDLLDTQTLTWDTTITSQLNNILSQRQDAEMARVGQWVLVWGGENATGPLSDGVRLDLSSGYAYVATPAGPAARTRFSMTVLGDQIAIWGGEGLNGDLNDGALYDPASNTWANMATSVSIPARQGHQAFASGTELVLVGGESSGQAMDSVHAYSTATATWREVDLASAIASFPAAHLESTRLTVVTGREANNTMSGSLTNIDLTPNLYYYRKP